MSDLQKRVAATDWKYAKTYSEKLPHEYILRADHPDLWQEIQDLVDSEGQDERFYSRVFRYYFLGNFKYWTYDNLVNRTRIDGYTPEMKEKYLRELWVKNES